MARPEIDLHVHTTASDGHLTPSEVVSLALARGLDVLAITDHDSTDGVAPAREAAAGSTLSVLTGVEISTIQDGQEIHLLGYLFNPDDPVLAGQFRTSREGRIGRAEAMVEKLAALDAPVSMDRVLTISAGGTLGRPHIAQALVEAGHVASYEEAFDRYLGNGKPAYVARYRLPLLEAIGLIHAAGGVAVLAHPVYVEGFRELFPTLVENGLDGLEVYYPKHDGALTAQLRELARRNGLITTGGTDFHRPNDSLPPGDVPVPRACVTQLYERAARYQG
ncbi:MAG: PHP domain-containing protein [Anaerolineae bacterium]|nr:PHP domain-containing protein [Anaerolineae bacterium]